MRLVLCFSGASVSNGGARLRNGVSGDDTSFVASARTTAKAVTVPNPPPGSPPPPTPPGAKGPGAPPPLLRSSPFGGSSVGSSGSGSPATTEEVTPDPGFVRGLPYGNRANPGDNSSDNPSVGLNRKGGNGSGNKGVLIPAAFGAILFVGAFQLRWLMRTIEQAPIPPIA